MDCAVIDIGSNSVRLMISSNGMTEKFLAVTQLGRGVSKTGNLSKESIQDTLVALEKFCAQAKDYPIYAFATEAVRSAKNGREFLSEVYQKIGLEVDLLSPLEEALAGFLGATDGKRATVIDIGGASTEFACGDRGVIERSVSTPIGAVKLNDKCKDDEKDAENYLSKTFGEFEFKGEIIGIGGTITTLGAMSLGLSTYQKEFVHGYVLTLSEVERLIEKLSCTSVDERMKLFPVLPAKRASVILSGALLLRYIMKKYNLPSVRLSDSDNTEGYLIMRGV